MLNFIDKNWANTLMWYLSNYYCRVLILINLIVFRISEFGNPSSILTWTNYTYIQKPNYKAIHASSTIIATKNYFSYLVHKRCWGPNFVWLRKMCARQRFYATHPMRILLPQLLRYREHCAQKKQTLILAWKTKLQLQQQQNKSS